MIGVSRRIKTDISSHVCIVVLEIGKDSRGITEFSVTLNNKHKPSCLRTREY